MGKKLEMVNFFQIFLYRLYLSQTYEHQGRSYQLHGGHKPVLWSSLCNNISTDNYRQFTIFNNRINIPFTQWVSTIFA